MMSCDVEVFREFNEDWNYDDDSDLIRLTEWIDVDFKPLADDDVIKKQVDNIDNQINNVMAVSEAKITELNGKKAELLAITDQSGDA